jgi:phosphatidylserine/phosphatidylglycerophosphate/cardiolipin synthase-like enzyme
MNLNQIPWIWAQAMVLADSPTKIPAEGAERSAASEPAGAAVLKADDAYSPPSATPALNAESVVDGLLALIRSARQDLLVVSPYFVPGPEIMDAFRAARSKGVRIRVLTNSLASNDAPLAHAGYARHRKALLEMGIELHEMRSEAANVRSALRAGTTGSSGGSAGASRAMLHTKLLVIDGRLVAVGSMNLDMRSQLQNTEIAVLIASRRFSQLAGDSIDESLPENSWRVDLDPKGKLVWRAPGQRAQGLLLGARCQPGTAPYAAAARASGSGQSALGVVCGQAHSCCRSRSGSACTQSLMAR